MRRSLAKLVSALSLLLSACSVLLCLRARYAMDVLNIPASRQLNLVNAREGLSLFIGDVGSGSSRSREAAPFVKQLRNSHIAFDGGFIGYMANSVGAPADALAAMGPEANHQLFAALDDPDKFAAAHVLLTWNNDISHSMFPRWNGLEPSFPHEPWKTSQMGRIKEQWRSLLRIRSYTISHWDLTLLLTLPPLIHLTLIVRSRSRRRSRGLCPACGYDIRATPTQCSECGHKPASAGTSFCLIQNPPVSRRRRR